MSVAFPGTTAFVLNHGVTFVLLVKKKLEGTVGDALTNGVGAPLGMLIKLAPESPVMVVFR
jgi:hypothetical protein